MKKQNLCDQFLAYQSKEAEYDEDEGVEGDPDVPCGNTEIGQCHGYSRETYIHTHGHGYGFFTGKGTDFPGSDTQRPAKHLLVFEWRE